MNKNVSVIPSSGPITTVTSSILLCAGLCGIAGAQPPTTAPPGTPGMDGPVGPTFEIVGEVEVTDVVNVKVADVVDVKNVNEPGREPYEAYVEFSRFGCSGFACENFNTLGDIILFDGPVVPAGKRLIVKKLSGRLPNNSVQDVSIVLQQTQIVSQQLVKFGFYGPFFGQFNGLAGFSTDAFVTYGPGERPHFNAILPSGNNFIGYVTLTGYLIDAI